MNQFKIKNIEDYIIRTNEVISNWNLCKSTTHAWFRGQGFKDWQLIPKIYRSDGIETSLEREYIRDFKLLANNFLKERPKDDFEWMFIMQHYGMPTRLLDWTESHLVALFFAVENYLDKRDSAVYIFNPWSFNLMTFGEISVPVHNDSRLKKYLLPDPGAHKREVEKAFPIAIRPIKTSSRILAQKGNFTIHGKIKTSLEQVTDGFNSSEQQEKIGLFKLVIDGKSKIKILKQLVIAGITHSVLFPDLDGLSKEISLRYSQEYIFSDINRSRRKVPTR